MADEWSSPAKHIPNPFCARIQMRRLNTCPYLLLKKKGKKRKEKDSRWVFILQWKARCLFLIIAVNDLLIRSKPWKKPYSFSLKNTLLRPMKSLMTSTSIRLMIHNIHSEVLLDHYDFSQKKTKVSITLKITTKKKKTRMCILYSDGVLKRQK